MEPDKRARYKSLWDALETLLSTGHALSDPQVVCVSKALDRLVLDDMGTRDDTSDHSTENHNSERCSRTHRQEGELA